MFAYFYDNDTGKFTNIYGASVEADYVESEFAITAFSCIIAGTDSLENKYLWDLCQAHSNAKFFMFNTSGEVYDELSEEIYFCGKSIPSFNYYLQVIMRDFILNDLASLQKYDDMEGRCNVTFMPVFPGTGGWLLMPQSIEYPLDPKEFD